MKKFKLLFLLFLTVTLYFTPVYSSSQNDWIYEDLKEENGQKAIHIASYYYSKKALGILEEDTPEHRTRIAGMPEKEPEPLSDVFSEEQTYHEIPQKLTKEDRNSVDYTLEWPYQTVSFMTMEFRVGGKPKKFKGTGVLVGPCHVLTVAHNLYDRMLEQWAEKVTVYPALEKGLYKDEGQGVRLIVPSLWKDGQDNEKCKEYDLGMIILGEQGNSFLGDRYGFLGISKFTPEYLQNQPVTMTGYPGDLALDGKPPQQMQMTCELKDHENPRGVFAEVIRYGMYTYTGNSGSPVWLDDGERHYIIGIHAYGEVPDPQFPYTQATRISETKFNLVTHWIKAHWPVRDKINLAIEQLFENKVQFLEVALQSNINVLQQLNRALQTNTSLESLQIQCTGLRLERDVIDTGIIGSLFSHHNLKYLSLSAVGLDTNDLIELCTHGLNNLQSLQVLDLSKNRIDSFQYLLKTLNEVKKTSLVSMDLTGNLAPKDQNWKEINKILWEKCENLFKGKLEKLSENDHGAQLLLKSFRDIYYRLTTGYNPEKKEEDLSKQELKEERLKFLVTVARKKLPQLKLSSCNIGSSPFALDLLYNILIINNTLTKLELVNNFINDDGLISLIGAFKPQLVELSLEKNDIGVRGLRALAHRLSPDTKLHLEDSQRPAYTSFYNILHGYQSSLKLEGYGKRYLPESWLPDISYFTWLIGLSLPDNQIKDKDVKYISLMGGLTFLNLSTNLLEDDGAISIAENLPLLEHLNLANNRVGDKGGEKICEKLLRLSVLNISGTWVNAPVVIKLAQREAISTLVANEGLERLIDEVREIVVNKGPAQLNLSSKALKQLKDVLNLEKFSSMTELDLSYNDDIQNADADYIADAIGQEFLPHLAVLSVVETNINIEGVLSLLGSNKNLDLQISPKNRKLSKFISDFKNASKLESLEFNFGLSSIDRLPLSEFSRVTDLNLSNNQLTYNELQDVPNQFPNLEILDLRHNILEGQNKKITFYNNFQTLRVLKLSHSSVSDVSAKYIARNLTKLEELEIERTKISSKGVLQLAQKESLRLLTTENEKYRILFNEVSSFLSEGSTELNLSDKALNSLDGFDWQRFERLKTLNLSKNTLSNKAMAQLKKFKNLTELSISENKNISDRSLSGLRKIPLSKLDIMGTSITERGIMELAQSEGLKLIVDEEHESVVQYVQDIFYEVRQSAKEKELRLPKWNIRSLKVVQLKYFRDFEKLVLPENNLENDAVELIARGLKRLKQLDLEQNDITKFDITLENLVELNLSQNRIVEFAPNISDIKKLIIANSNIEDPMLKYIAENFHELEYLDLSNNKITNQGAEVISQLTNLNELYLSNNQLGGGDKHKVKKSKYSLLKVRGSLQAISLLPKLETLGFEKCGVEAHGEIIYLLEAKNALKKIYLANNPLKDKDSFDNYLQSYKKKGIQLIAKERK